MAFTGAATVSQSQLTPTNITLTDTSSYASEGQGTFTTRRITITLADGTTVVPKGTLTSYVDWPFSDGSTKTINVLTRDYAPIVKVDWIKASPVGGSTYTLSANYFFSEMTENFYYHLTQLEAADGNIARDVTFMKYKFDLRVHLDSGAKAIGRDGDVYSGQAALDRAYNLITNQLSFY